MPNHVLLNNIDHKGLRIDTGRDAALGDDVMFTVTFPAEFRSVQAHYPIVFHKDAQGELQPVAMFGFYQGKDRQGSNLFLDGGHWDATYVPLAIERQPFLIGRDGEQLMVHIDLDHPRVRSDRGEMLFRDQGGTTDYLDRITSVLMTLHDGLEGTPAFMAAMLRHDLIESFTLDGELADGAQHRLAGFYTIHEERLAALPGDALGRLNAAGHLQPIYMAVASVAQFRSLIERRNRRDAAAA